MVAVTAKVARKTDNFMMPTLSGKDPNFGLLSNRAHAVDQTQMAFYHREMGRTPLNTKPRGQIHFCVHVR